MNEDIKLAQQEQILRLVEELEQLTPGSEEAKRQGELIAQLLKSITDSEKETHDNAAKQAQLELDKQKHEDEVDNEKWKNGLEEQKIDAEKEKLKIEAAKVELEEKKLEEAIEARKAKDEEAKRQVEIEEKKIQIEQEKLKKNVELERAKLEQEKKRAEQAAKDEKREFWLGVGRIGFEAARIGLLIFSIKKGMGTVMAFEQTGIARSNGWHYVDKMVNMAVK